MDVRGKVVQARIPVHQDVPLIADLALSRKLVDMKVSWSQKQFSFFFCSSLLVWNQVHQEGVPSEFASKTGELRTSLKGCKVAELRERYEMHGKKDKQPEHTSFVDVTFKCRTLVTDKELRPRYPENSQLESTEAFAIVPGISWGDLNTERLRNFDFSHNLTTGILDVVMYGLGGSNSDVLNSSEIARIDFVFKSPEVWGCKFAVYECHSSSKILTRRSKAEFGLFAKKCNVKKVGHLIVAITFFF